MKKLIFIFSLIILQLSMIGLSGCKKCPICNESAKAQTMKDYYDCLDEISQKGKSGAWSPVYCEQQISLALSKCEQELQDEHCQ